MARKDEDPSKRWGDYSDDFHNAFKARSVEPAVTPTSGPRIILQEDDLQFVITAQLPGVEKKDVNFHFTHHGVAICVQTGMMAEIEEEDGYRFVSSLSHFYRLIDLSEPIDRSRVRAVYQDDVLTITAPKEFSESDAGSGMGFDSHGDVPME